MKPIQIIFSLVLAGLSTNIYSDEAADPAEIVIGERLFLETRFAQAWSVNPGKPDPALAKTITTGKSRLGSFAQGTMNCRACHMVDEHQDDLGMRIYADFAAASPIPDRKDGNHKTGRNSMALVNISKDDVSNILFHFDGEFNSLEDLVVGTFTGRNFGWRADEKQAAIKHIGKVIRNDDGTGELAKEFGGSYSKILTGTDESIAKEFRLPAEYRVNTSTASDEKILNAVAKLVTAYTASLSFATDDDGLYSGSPYDIFLKLNKLPRAPEQGETKIAYNNRLLQRVNTLSKPFFVSKQHGDFESHQQSFQFGKKELKGLQLFLRSGDTSQSGGNCASCHQAPHFTDFRFHNTGISQNQYDKLHGNNTFNKLAIPSLGERNKNPARYLPASSQHPDASSMFRAHASKDKPGYTDLGLWNVFANNNIPGPQQKIIAILCDANQPCDTESMLKESIASFKTPSLRDSGHSAPYMHTGELRTLEEVLAMYVTNSQLAQQGKLRNTDKALTNIRLTSNDINHLVAFINSLNEDYD